MKIKKIDHFVITTRDMESCIQFYKLLGFVAFHQGSYIELYAGDFKINVHFLGAELSPRAQNVQTGSADFCFEINEDLDLFKEELIQKGVCIELGVIPRTGVKGNMNSIYLRDPDGNLIEFAHYD